MHTPWGFSDSSKSYARGIIFYTTPSHGGFHVSPTLNAKIPEYMREENGWYEEDCAWAKVVVCFPNLFPDDEIKQAHQTMCNWYPHEWEKLTGLKVHPDNSHILRKENFEAAHNNDWVVISAWGDWNNDVPKGFVGVCATIGGERDTGNNIKYFLVPKEEYHFTAAESFVVDTDKHKEINLIR